MQEQKTEILRVEHLKKYFTTPKGTLHAVDDVNFSIRTGETLGVVGESGCGKSTMGRAILRLHEPTSGKVYFEGKDILGYNKKQLKDLRKDMQIIFQDPFASLNPRMTVSEAIIEPLLVQGIYKPNEKAAITQQVEKIMNLVGLAKRLVRHFSNDIVVMYLGQMVESAPAKALFKNPMHPYTKALLSAIPVPDPDFKMERIPLKGELTSPINPEPGCRFAKRCPYATEGCTSNEMTLKEMEPGHFVSCRMVQEQG